MFKTHTSIEKNKSGSQTKNRGKRIKYKKNDDTTLKYNTHINELSIRQNPMRITNIT